MGLRKLMDNIKPTFSKGGKLGFLESTFDAFETFLFVPTPLPRRAHIRDCNDMKRTMIMVVVALMPAFFFGCYNTGIQVGLEGFTAFFYGLVRVLPWSAFRISWVWASSSDSHRRAATRSTRVSSFRVC